MLTRIVCPNCGHVGATAAMLPRVLICSQGHGALIRSGKPARPPTIITGEEDAFIDGTTVAGADLQVSIYDSEGNSRTVVDGPRPA